MTTTHLRPAGSGWFTFAGVMFCLSGFSNLLWGLGALDNKHYLSPNGLLFGSLSTWGWVSLAWAAFTLIVGILLITRNPWSAGLGVVMAMMSAAFWIFAIPLVPIWSLLIIVIDILIIYGLIAHLEAARD